MTAAKPSTAPFWVGLAIAALLAACDDEGNGPPVDARSDRGLDDAPSDVRPVDSSSDGRPADVPSDEGVVPGIRSGVVYTSEPGEGAPTRHDLAWRNGTLFVGHSSPDYAWVFSIPHQGGAKNLLYEGHMRRFWLEDDRLMYAQNNDLFEIPQAGGPPKAVVHYGDGTGNLLERASDRNLDRSAIYWATNEYYLTVFSRARAGGKDTVLARSDSTSARDLWMTADRLVVSRDVFPVGGEPYVATLPKTGGTLTPLPNYGKNAKLLSVSAAGALLWRQLEISNDAGATRLAYTLGRSDINGATPQRFATTLSGTAAPDQAWAAAAGTWYVATIEGDWQRGYTLDLWYVTADGNARHLLGRPAPNPDKPLVDNGGVTLTAAVVVDDGIFVSLQNIDRSWSIVAIENPGAGRDPVAGSPDGGTADAGTAAPNCPTAPVDAAPGTSGQITEFPVPTANGTPSPIARGPDGALWFGEVQTNSLGRITTSGCISEFRIGNSPHAIVAGPNNYLWFTQTGIDRIARILIDGTLFEQFPIAPRASRPDDMVMGPDGNLWFTQQVPSAISRMTLTGVVTEFRTPTELAGPRSVTVGPDGALWFTEWERWSLGRIDPANPVVTEIPVPSGSRPSLLVTGPDGNLWSFGSQLAGSKTIVRLTPPNTFTEFPYPADRAASTLISGPDGHLWMLDPPANRITRMSPVDRTFRDYPVPTPNAGLTQMTFGPDGNLWFTEISAGKIGRLIP